MISLGAIVDTTDLWQTVAAAFIAGIGVTLAFSVGILGAARLMEANRDGRGLAGVLFAGMATAGFLATLAAVVFGLVLMTTD